MMHADITDQNSVFGQCLINFNSGALWVNRGTVIHHARGNKCIPFPPIAVNGIQPFAACFCWRAIMPAPVKLGQNLSQEGAHISHQSQRNWIVAADFFWVNVHMN